MNGVNLDIDPVELPDDVYTAAGDMVSKPGKMIRAKGYEEVYATPLFGPYFTL